QRPVDGVPPDDQPAAQPGRVGVRDNRGYGGRTLPGDIVGDGLQLGKGLAGHRLCEDIDDSSAGEANGECVVVGDSVAVQLGLSVGDDLVGEFVDGRLDA